VVLAYGHRGRGWRIEDGRWQGQRLGYQGPLGFISLY
jgi:hypothetical protein